MTVFGKRFPPVAALCLCAAALLVSRPAWAQSSLGSGGFAAKAAATVTGDELRTQTDLWILEVDLKPMRMVSVEVTDPRTREKKREWVWYLVWKAVARPIQRRADASDTSPVNDYDVQPKRPLFVPEFAMMTRQDEDGPFRIVKDTIIPEAEPIILKREKRLYKNTVDVVRPIPEATPFGTPAKDVIHGVAMWRGVDPKTDYFVVFMGGFSNGYRMTKGPDGRPLIERRTVMQEFWRPGDRFDQNEVEMRFKGTPKWVYRADEPAAVEEPPAAKPPAEQPADPNADDDNADAEKP